MIRTHVDLFSGVGGFSLACEWAGIETIAHAEIDDYASRVLRKHWPGIRNYGDVRNVPALDSVWLVTGGVPCQPASVAGKRRGAQDDRWLWPQALAAVERIRSAWVLFENPTGILSLNDGVEFERICLALEGQGYEVQALIIPACAVGAKHRRDRVWIMAHANGARCPHGPRAALGDLRGQYRETAQVTEHRQNGNAGIIADGLHGTMANFSELQRYRRREWTGRWDREPEEALCHLGRDGWENDGMPIPESDLGRVVHGVPSAMDRLRCLGNAIVPQVAFQLIKRMIESEETV